MFLKPFRIKTQSALKNSDRKKLRADICTQYPTLSVESAATLIPNKEDMSATKVSAHGGEVVLIYFVMKTPVFFESYKKLYPTVYTLWKFPDLVPVFRTWSAVFEKLQNGADLMLPGVVFEKEPSPKMFGNLKKGDIVSVSLAGNRSPVALGQALLSGEDMYLSAMRGKGVGIIHILGDALWEAGDKSTPPSLPEYIPGVYDQETTQNGNDRTEDAATAEMPNLDSLQIIDGTSTSDKQEGDTLLACDDNGDGGSSDEEECEEKNPVAEMDALLHFCFACAIKSRIKEKDLPLLTVRLMREFMQPFSPAKRLDVKQSSFKKLGRFLQQKVSEAYITIKEQTRGVDAITSFDNSHPGLKGLDVPEAVEEESPIEAAASSTEEDICKPLTFTDVYCVNAVTQNLFKELRITKDDVLKIADVRELVNGYIKQNDLLKQENTKQVTLDPILAHTILKASEGDLDHMPLEQVVNRIVGKMQQCVAVSNSDGLISIKKGKLEPIKLDVKMKASNKKMTVIENLEDYGFDLKVFARTVQRTVACSSSVVQPVQKDKGPQVLVQGNQITFIGKMLIEKCKIPRKYIVGLEKAPKQKKR